MNLFQQVNQLNEADIVATARLIRADDKKSWVCPKCGNGSHGHKGDGIRQKLYHGRLTWHCYGCGEHMSNVDVIAAAYDIDDKDKAKVGKKLAELFPNLSEDKDFFSLRKDVVMSSESAKTVGKNYSRMYEVCRRALPQFLARVGGVWRGLTNETLHEAGIGYNSNYRNKQVVILPYDEQTFFWREVNGKAKGVNVGGKRRLYEAMALKTGGSTVNFLMEGELDALSVKQALFSFKENFGVAATGSINFAIMMMRELESRYKTVKERPRFIWLGDNDRRGVEGATKMIEALKTAGYSAISAFFAEKGMAKVDANQYLQDKGTVALTRWLFDVVYESETKLDEVKREIQKSRVQTHGIKISSLSEYLGDDFDEELDRVTAYAGRATGFDNLDEEQIFLPGVYILGGSPGAGKTTFAWQLLSQLVEGDECKGRAAEHCVYCSYEMSRLELASKSIAREMRRRQLANKGEGLCLSSADIRRGNGRNTQEFKEARSKFRATAKNLRVAELSNTTLSELLVILKGEAEALGDKSLTVVIDYLQLIPVENAKATAKERVDEVMLALKTFQRETNATLIVISAMNREGNRGVSNTLFSFKESGAIEYSADVTWHLGFPVESEEERKIMPRRVELKCMKNRNGATYKVEFDYYADSDYFCPCSVGAKIKLDSEDSVKKRKSNRH